MHVATVIIGLTLLLALALGLAASRGRDMDMEQWTTGGRGFGTIFIFLLMAGEIYTTNAFLGISGFAYGHGASAFFNISIMMFVVAYWLTPKIWKYGKQHSLQSQSDFFTRAYNNKGLSILVAIIGLIALVPYLVIQLKGLGIIVSEASYGAIPPVLSIWIGTLAMVAYTITSGIRGSAWTATIKDILILIVVIGVGVYLPIHYFGGIGNMYKAAESLGSGYTRLPSSGFSAAWYVSTVVMVSIGFYMWPHTFVATFSAKSGKALRRNAIVLPFYTLFILFVLFAGTTAALQVPGLTGGDIDLAMLRISKETFSPVIVGLIGAGGLLAAIVPGSLILMSAATLLVKNVLEELSTKRIEARITATFAKLSVPVIAGVALIATFQGGKAITLLLLMGYGLVTQMAPAVIGKFLPKNPFSVAGVYTGLVIGAAIIVSQALGGWTIRGIFPTIPAWVQDINIGVIAVIVNVVAAAIVSVFTKHATVAGDDSSDAAIPETGADSRGTSIAAG